MFSFRAHEEAENMRDIFRQERRRNFVADVVPTPDDNDRRSRYLDGQAFSTERSYFSVRLVEMRLAEAGNYFSTYLPMCTCFLSFPYGGGTRNVPYIVKLDMLKDKIGADAPTDLGKKIEFKNIYIVRDIRCDPAV